MSEKSDWEWIHTKIHALRMIQNYKPSIFEQEINKFIAEKYQDICDECKERLMKIKYAPPIQEKKGFSLKGLFD